jgi:diguanylate cyclase (GGDEF)-like protein
MNIVSWDLKEKILDSILNDSTDVNLKWIEYTKDFLEKKELLSSDTCNAVEILIEYKNLLNLKTDSISRIFRKLIFSLNNSSYKYDKLLSINLIKLWELKNKDIESTTDQLTWLNNRRSVNNVFKSYIEKFKKYWTSFSILLIDLDDFKEVNDNYWHKIWDRVLKNIASELKDYIRSSDFSARWWWEEFLIILGSTNKEDAYNKADMIRQMVSKTSINGSIRNTCSIWVVTSEKNISCDNLIELADHAMYKAKNSWKDRVCVA